MKHQPLPKEKIRHQHIHLSHDIDVLQAAYYQQHFSRHTHDGYAFGIITSGTLDFSYRQQKWHALPGDINLVVPGEAHDGQAGDFHGWSYRMIYLPADILQDASYQSTGKDELPWFLPGCIQQSPLAQPLAALHTCLANPSIALLQKESALLHWLTAFIEQYNAQKLPCCKIGQEPQAISRTMDYLQNNFAASISLQDLAKIANLSPYYLLRSFEKSVGLPPHLYQQQLRIEKARELLARNQSPAQVALATGFADQSHFTRQFKKITGLTPAGYQKAISTATCPFSK